MVVELVLLLLLNFCCLFCMFPCPIVVVSAAPTPTVVCANSGDGTTPVMLGEPLRFCGNTGISCCDAVDDDALRKELHALRITDATCAAIVKNFLCKRCTPSLSFVFTSADPTKLSVPLLCGSAQAQAQEQDTSSMCLERISALSFNGMTAHPDGSSRVVFSGRDGKLWLATVPRRGDGAAAALRINDGGSARRPRPFLDLTDRVHLSHHDDGAPGGVMGMAFHPEFTTNGRFFVSYICDSSSVSCGGSLPSRYHLVVAEFSAQGDAGADFSKASRADPSEVRRIFTLGLPQPQYKLYSYQRHGGQILFRPSIDDYDRDGYLYLVTGYGYSSNKQQNGSSSFLGKILKFSVGNGPAGGREWPEPDTDRHPEWTNKPEVFAVGLSNPSSCSFDSGRPWRLFCADVNEQRSERVYLITSQMGGERGSSSSSRVTIVVNRGHPADDGRMPTIVGGLVYRGSADTSLKGRYLYVYGSRVWSGRDASAHLQALNVNCSWSSPVPCRSSAIDSRVLSMAEDNSKDAFFLTAAGVFRVVPSGACGAGPQPQLPTDGVGWQLAVVATAMVLALLFIWFSKLLGSGGPLISIDRCSCGSCCSGWSFFGNIFHQSCPHHTRETSIQLI